MILLYTLCLAMPGADDSNVIKVSERVENIFFQIYWRLIGRPYIALARQDKIYRNISNALGRLRSDHEYFSTYPKTNISQCIAEKKRKGLVKVATTVYIYNSF